nr:retrotransposon Orf1 [Tanacetum cinerariifolium]
MLNRIHSSINAITICPKPLSKSHNDETKEGERGERNNTKNINTTPPPPPDPSILFVTKTIRDDDDVMFIEIIRKYDDSHKEGPADEGNATTEGLEVGYFDTFLIKSELAYHKYLVSGPIPSLFIRNPIITKGCPSNLKIPCNIGHVHVEKAYIDLYSPLNVMTRMLYNWIMRRIKGMHVFVGNFTYVIDFMIVEDISSIIDPRLSQVVLGKRFAKISNMTHDPPKGVVRFTNRTDEIAYKMLHKIEQYNSLSDLEREYTKSVYLRN